jgi:hypothetical protein
MIGRGAGRRQPACRALGGGCSKARATVVGRQPLEGWAVGGGLRDR